MRPHLSVLIDDSITVTRERLMPARRHASLRRLALSIPVFMLVAILSSSPETANAVSHDGNPKILLHVKPVTTKNMCTSGSLSDCRQAVTEGSLVSSGSGPFHFVYVLGARPASFYDGLAGLQFGLDYQNSLPGSADDGQGLDIFSWNLCSTLQFATDGDHPWPEPGSGNLITWDPQYPSCQRGEVGVAGYFYVGAYAADSLRITVHPLDRQAKVADCESRETLLSGKDLGFAVFSTNSVPGCNPCDQNCPEFAIPPPPPPPPPGIPQLAVSPASVHLQYLSATKPPGSFLVSNVGQGELSVRAESNQAWLSVPGEIVNVGNSLPRTFFLTVNSTGMLPGQYSASITLRSNDPADSLHIVPVTVELGSPIIQLQPISIELAARFGTSVSGPVQVLNQGATLLHWSLEDFPSWLSAAPGTGVTESGSPVAVTLTADAAGLALGDYRDTLRVLSDDPAKAEVLLPVHFEIREHVLGVEPDTVDITIPWGGGASAVPVLIRNLSSSPGIILADPSAPWLQMTPVRLELGNGSTGAMTVRVDASSFDPGHFETVIPINSTNESRTLCVRVDILSTPPDLVVTPSSLVFEAPAGGASRAGTVLLHNQGFEVLNVTMGESSTWLQLVESSVAIGPGGSHVMPLIVIPDGLTPGTYDGAVSLSANDPDLPLSNLAIRLVVRDAPAAMTTGGIVIDEFFTSCANGDTLPQFIEILSIGGGQTYRSSLGLRIEDGAGIVRYQAIGFASGVGEGTGWPIGQSFLIGTAAEAARGAPGPDHVAAIALDPIGGVITLFDGNPTTGVLQRLPYGTRGTHASPDPGTSLVRAPSGTYSMAEIPAPRNRVGGVGAGPHCPCPVTRGLFDGRDVTFTGSTADSTYVGTVPSYVGTIRFNLSAESMFAYGSRGYTRATTTDVFSIRGLAAGAPMAFEARLRFQATGSVNNLFPTQSAKYEASMKANGGPASSSTRTINHVSWPRYFDTDSTLTTIVATRAGRSFTLEGKIGAGGTGDGGAAQIGPTTLMFRGLLPGVLLESCGGFEKVTPVPVKLSVISAEVVNGRALLLWAGPGLIEPLFVDRRTARDEWATVGRVSPDADGRYLYEDHDVRVGESYAWRLRGSSILTDETWLEIPGTGSPQLSLSARWDAGRRVVLARVAWPASGPADLSLHDITGRLVERRELVVDAAGQGDVVIDSLPDLSSGIYFLRCHQSGSTARARVVVVD